MCRDIVFGKFEEKPVFAVVLHRRSSCCAHVRMLALYRASRLEPENLILVCQRGSTARVARSERPAAQNSGGVNTGCEMRSEEHTSELQSLMRISYAVFCLKKKT